jgi:hypothetical protein
MSHLNLWDYHLKGLYLGDIEIHYLFYLSKMRVLYADFGQTTVNLS